jgi:hypothetical protein
MIPAMLATMYVMFLYWHLNESEEPAPAKDPIQAMQDEIASINSRLVAIQAKLKANG